MEYLYLLIGVGALALMLVLKTAKKIVRTLFGLAAAAAIILFVYTQFLA